MPHPRTMPEGTKLWFGPEIEGALAQHSPMTAFITGELEAHLVVGITTSTAVRQIFLTEKFEAWAWYQDVLLPLARMKGWRVTVGRYVEQLSSFFALPANVRETMVLMVRIFNAPWLSKLRPCDEISLGEPFNLVSFRVGDGVATVPSQYDKDQLVIPGQAVHRGPLLCLGDWNEAGEPVKP